MFLLKYQAYISSVCSITALAFQWLVVCTIYSSNNVKNITNTLIQNPKMYETVNHISTLQQCFPHRVFWTNSSVNTFIKQKVLILNINQYKKKQQQPNGTISLNLSFKTILHLFPSCDVQILQCPCQRSDPQSQFCKIYIYFF